MIQFFDFPLDKFYKQKVSTFFNGKNSDIYYCPVIGDQGESSEERWMQHGKKTRLLSCSAHLPSTLALSTYLRRKRSTWSAPGEEKGGWASWAGLRPELCTLYRLYYCPPTDSEDPLLLVHWGCTRPFFETSSSLAKWRCNSSLSSPSSLISHSDTNICVFLSLFVVCATLVLPHLILSSILALCTMMETVYATVCINRII